MADHAYFVWDKYVKDSGFDKIDVVAHSAGGFCLKVIMTKNEETFWNRANKLAYTDSFVIEKSVLSEKQ